MTTTFDAASVQVPRTEPVDALLATEDVYLISPAEAGRLRVDLMRYSIAQQRRGNAAYDSYCRARGFSEDTLGTEDDLARVPLLPSALFKRASGVVSSLATGPVLATTSSGTQGTVSTVPRCDVTLLRFFASVAAGNRELLGHERLDQRVLHVGPTMAGAPTLWIAYVMAGVGVIMPSQSYMSGSTVALDLLTEHLADTDRDAGVTMIGPPALLVDVADHVAGLGGLRLRKSLQVVTMGGWKRLQGESVDRPTFRERTVDAFGLDGTDQVRDTYNMVELNSVLFECGNHTLHVPPWLHVGARDPRTLRPLPEGGTGVLAFLDPTPVSYPGYLLSDDFGIVRRHVDCPCGIHGDSVTVTRRINRVESRGCALKLDTIATGAPSSPEPREVQP